MAFPNPLSYCLLGATLCIHQSLCPNSVRGRRKSWSCLSLWAKKPCLVFTQGQLHSVISACLSYTKEIISVSLSICLLYESFIHLCHLPACLSFQPEENNANSKDAIKNRAWGKFCQEPIRDLKNSCIFQAKSKLIKLRFWWFQKSIEMEVTMKHAADAAREMATSWDYLLGEHRGLQEAQRAQWLQET